MGVMPHLTDDRLDEYVMGRMTMGENEHLASCNECRQRLTWTCRYVSAMKSAAVRFMSTSKKEVDAAGPRTGKP